jgi:hypothetical protein
MPRQKDRHLESPGEANRDKHINFVALKQGDDDPRSETFENDADSNSTASIDNGFFSDDDTRPGKETDSDQASRDSDESNRSTSLQPGDKKTVADKADINRNKEDLATQATDQPDAGYANEDDQAH